MKTEIQNFIANLKEDQGDLLTLANVLTVGRLLVMPFIILFMFIPMEWAAWVALVLYAIGSITDFLDGWVARKFDQISEFGTFLDPIVDKIYVFGLMIMIVAVGHVGALGILMILLIMTREFLVSGLREYLGPKGIKVPVTNLAKWKTTIQLIATGVLIIAPYIWGGTIIGHLLLFCACALTIHTGIEYLKVGLAQMRKMP